MSIVAFKWSKVLAIAIRNRNDSYQIIELPFNIAEGEIFEYNGE